MPTGELRAAIDVSNTRCYSGTGNTVKNLVQPDNSVSGPTTATTVTDTNRLVLNNNTTSTNSIDINFSPAVNHESWTLIFWAKYVAIPNSNFRSFLRLVDEVNPNSVGYFYNVDTRETTNNYILGYQKDQAISSWTSHNWTSTQTNWQSGDWICCATTHSNGVYKSYGNGALNATQTVTQDVDLYGDISILRFFGNNATGSLLGPTYFYGRVLSDDEILQAYNCHKDIFQ